MRTTFFDGIPEHDGRDHGAYPLPYVEFDATTGTQQLADIRAEDIMLFGLDFWAVSAAELDLFTELAATRQARAP